MLGTQQYSHRCRWQSQNTKFNEKGQQWYLTDVPYIRESSTQWDSVHSETKALYPIRNFIIIFMLTTRWYDAIMKLLKHKGWSVEAWLV